MIKTRIAPSPTGPLHIGTARTALYNYLFSKKKKGIFVLRMEDTDLERSNLKYEEDIKRGLGWLGIKWDEFYRQSENLKSHKKYLKKLLNDKKAFYCYHTKEELEKEKADQMERKEAPRHICRHREKEPEKKLVPGLIRLAVPQKKIIFYDEIRGKVEFNSELLGNFSLAKNIDTPLYNFAVVIDDSETQISHVIRGEDHISNTPKQILIQEALGLKKPIYAHLPLILGSDKSKLSKRHGATAISELKEKGYLPEAMVNFIALLGWHPGNDKELFSLEQLIKEFSLKKTQKSGAIFNLDKLNWINGEYIKQADLAKLAGITNELLKRKGEKIEKEKLIRILTIEKDRIKILSEISTKTEELKFFFEEPEFDEDLLRWKNQSLEEAKENLKKVSEILENLPTNNFEIKKLEDVLMPLADDRGRGEVLWPLRVALSGRKKSPGPYEIAYVLGKKETLSRIQKILRKKIL